MKNYTYLFIWLFSFFAVSSCSDDKNDMTPGNPVLELKTKFTGAHFGDKLPFTVNASDNMPLSTLLVRLYFGDEKVSEKTIRTKENGEYSDFIAIPFLKDTPDGKARLEFTLTDTHLSSTVQDVELPLSRPQFPYLILVTETESYPMLPTGTPNEYAVSESFPSTDLPAYIKAPVVGANGSEISFGWDAGKIQQGIVDRIPFSSAKGGKYTVSFNTLTYAATPFFEVFIDGQKLTTLDKENLQVDMNFTKDKEVIIKGLDLAEWWIDPDFFKKGANNQLSFAAIDGKYRVIANTSLKYLRVQAMTGSTLSSLQPDGSGAIWIIGENVGKPSVGSNEVGWNADKAICMAPIGNKKYQVTLVGGQQVSTAKINFKFYHQLGWGSDGKNEFRSTAIISTSSLVFIGDGTNGRDNGNLGLKDGITLESGATYTFTVEASPDYKAVLSVVKK